MTVSSFPGLLRIKRVYPPWFLFYFALVSGMIYFEIKLPMLLFSLAIIFLIKDIVIDFELLHIKRPRVYWADHAPLSFLIAVVGIAGYFLPYFSGYVTLSTAILFGIDFFADLYKDVTEDPAVYSKVM